MKCDTFGCNGLAEIPHKRKYTDVSLGPFWFCRKCIKFHLDCCDGCVG